MCRLLSNVFEIVKTKNFTFLVQTDQASLKSLYRLKVFESSAVVSKVNFAGSFLPILSINCIEEKDGEVFLAVTQGNRILEVTNLFVGSPDSVPETPATAPKTFKLFRKFISSSPSGVLDFQPIRFAEGVYMANVLEDDQKKRIYLNLQRVISQLRNSKKHGTLIKLLQGILRIFEFYQPEYVVLGKPDSSVRPVLKSVSLRSLRKWFHRQLTRTTVITFDAGSSWEYLTQNENRLNLNILSQEIHSPLLSGHSAQGIIFGIGNFGKCLGPEDQWSTFVSSDFGKKWGKVHKEKLLYETTASADLVILARDSEPTNQIMFSWDYGASFKDMIISDSSTLSCSINQRCHFFEYFPRAQQGQFELRFERVENCPR